MAIRLPKFTDLTNEEQIRELNRLLSEFRNGLSKTAMPKEEARPREDSQAQENRFRVVDREVSPSSGSYDSGHTQEVQFWVGNKWMRVMLEDL